MTNDTPVAFAYEQLARIGKCVSSPHRIQILELLAQGEKSVEALARDAGLSVKNASAHLRVLRGARLVEARKEAKFSFYRLADPTVSSFVISLRNLAERRLAEVREFAQQFLHDRERLNAVDREHLVKCIRSGDIVVLDVRATSEYEAGHIPGARSVPLDDLESALDSIPKTAEIVAYCRGPYCGLSGKAVELLRSKGYKATSIQDSVVDWTDSGFDLDTACSTSRDRDG